MKFFVTRDAGNDDQTTGIKVSLTVDRVRY